MQHQMVGTAVDSGKTMHSSNITTGVRHSMHATAQATNIGNDTILLDTSQEVLDPRNFTNSGDIEGYNYRNQLNDYELSTTEKQRKR